MKKYLGTILTSVIVITWAVLCFVFSPVQLNDLQLETLLVLGIICGASFLYCFIVGEITRNNSQMDKLWSILPIVYSWVIAGKGGMQPRAVIFAIIVTLWGIRLTSNFARKGAYQLKFWAGEEDYRWLVLRQNKYLQNKVAWAAFDFFFVSLFQNVLVLGICLPSLATMASNEPLGVFDFLAFGLAFAFLLLETMADEQQMYFHTTKNKMLAEGKTLEELPAPYNKGFNTTGLWARSRHPNYFGEQAIWICLALVVLGAKLSTYYVFHWSFAGALLLVILFLGSSAFGEGVSNSKYPEYHIYLNQVSKYVPLRKYRPETND